MSATKPITLAGTLVTDFHIAHAWRGMWVVDCELDLDPSAPVPSGTLTLDVFGTSLVGVIDAGGTARFADRVLARVIAGTGQNWNTLVARRDFHDDGFVKLSDVVNATAADIGETVTEIVDVQLAVDYARTAGVASRVFFGLDWYVDFAGQTHVVARPMVTTIPDDIEVLDYDPATRMLRLGAETSLVVPGMSFTDTYGRWDGALIVRDVEQTFTEAGDSHAIALCSSSTTDQGFRGELEKFIVEVAQVPVLKTYRYRVTKQGADLRLNLQAVNPQAGVPDTILVSAWPGVPGVSAKVDFTKGPLCVVVFLDGDFARPAVVQWDPSVTPLEWYVDAVTEIRLGKNATAFAARGDLVGNELGAVETTLGTGVANLATGVVTFTKPYVPGNVNAVKVKVE